MTIDASVLIATRARPDRLAATLTHLSRQATDGVRFEVVVAEDGVLDLSRRGDVAAVEHALTGVTVDP